MSAPWKTVYAGVIQTVQATKLGGNIPPIALEVLLGAGGSATTLSCSAAGESTASASMTLEQNLTASSGGGSTASGNIVLTISLTLASTGGSAASGNIVLSISLVMSSAGLSVVQASFSGFSGGLQLNFQRENLISSDFRYRATSDSLSAYAALDDFSLRTTSSDFEVEKTSSEFASFAT